MVAIRKAALLLLMACAIQATNHHGPDSDRSPINLFINGTAGLIMVTKYGPRYEIATRDNTLYGCSGKMVKSPNFGELPHCEGSRLPRDTSVCSPFQGLLHIAKNLYCHFSYDIAPEIALAQCKSSPITKEMFGHMCGYELDDDEAIVIQYYPFDPTTGRQVVQPVGGIWGQTMKEGRLIFSWSDFADNIADLKKIAPFAPGSGHHHRSHHHHHHHHVPSHHYSADHHHVRAHNYKPKHPHIPLIHYSYDQHRHLPAHHYSHDDHHHVPAHHYSHDDHHHVPAHHYSEEHLHIPKYHHSPKHLHSLNFHTAHPPKFYYSVKPRSSAHHHTGIHGSDMEDIYNFNSDLKSLFDSSSNNVHDSEYGASLETGATAVFNKPYHGHEDDY